MIQIVIFNIRTLNRIGQLPAQIASAIYHNKTIICIQEYIYLHSKHIKYHDTGSGWTFVSASAEKNSVNAAIGCVGMHIGPRALKSLNSVEKIQSRMVVTSFNDNPNATIISCYSCTNISEETDLIAFYNELSFLVRKIPKQNVLIIDEDMNAQIDKNVNNKFSKYNSSKRNGEQLTDLTLENRLIYLYTKFEKRKRKHGPAPTQITLKHR